MRKYVVPIAALLGIALLSPRADAANLILKSRVGVPGHAVSVPVAVTGVSQNELWGLDFGLTFTTLTVGTDASNNTAFTPFDATGSPVVVSGSSFVGSGTQPSLYIGAVRGTSKFATDADTNGSPSASIGLIRLAVPAGTANGTVIDLAVPATYNVANTGDGSTANARNGATGATSTATIGAAVNSETITVLDTYPAASGVITVPLHKVAVAAIPGDVVFSGASAGVITSGDYGKVAQAYVGKATLSDYEKIAADVAPANGYVPGSNYAGTAGLSYGDGKITSADYGLMAAKYVNKATAANFPVPE